MKRITNIIDIILIPICYLFVLSSFVKLLSLTFIYKIAINNEFYTVILFFTILAISAKATPPLYQEVLSWRLPLKEWLRLHRLKQ
jgi:hypothetical protein